MKDLIIGKVDMRIAVIGLGYIGLPLAIKLTEQGFKVVGVDINADVINQLLGGESSVEGISNERVKQAVEIDKRLELVVVTENPPKSDPPTIENLIDIQIFL